MIMTKYYFIINPAAGQGAARELVPEIDAVCSVAGIDYEIYATAAIGDAEGFVRERCEESLGAPEESVTLRFYACGGDGTLNEVVNGAAGYDFAEVGCIPAGTGNDFVRNFPEGNFDDLVAQIRGKASLCDLIHYEGICDGEYIWRYCVNMFNIGFDCNVVDMTARMKQMPLMSGSLAYLASVAAMLVEKKGADLRVEYPPEDGEGVGADAGALPDASDRNIETAKGAPAASAAAGSDNGGFVYDGKLLLIAVANGCFCGGGIKGIPRAVTDDGFFDVSLVKNVPRHVFVKLFPKYMEGTHLEEERLKDVIRYTHETSLHITPNKGTMKLCVDGEITEAGAVRFSIAPGAFRFIVPTRS